MPPDPFSLGPYSVGKFLAPPLRYKGVKGTSPTISNINYFQAEFSVKEYSSITASNWVL